MILQFRAIQKPKFRPNFIKREIIIAQEVIRKHTGKLDELQHKLKDHIIKEQNQEIQQLLTDITTNFEHLHRVIIPNKQKTKLFI